MAAATLELQLYEQHQPRRKLLAGRGDQPQRDAHAADGLRRGAEPVGTADGKSLLRCGARLVLGSQHRHLGHDQPRGRARRRHHVGQLEHGRRMDSHAYMGTLSLYARPPFPRFLLSLPARRGGVLHRLAHRERRLSADSSIHLAREHLHHPRRLPGCRLLRRIGRHRNDSRVPHRRHCCRPGAWLRQRPATGDATDRRPTAALSHRQRRQVTGMVPRLARPRADPPPPVAPLRTLSRPPHHPRRHPSTGASRSADSGAKGHEDHGMECGMARQPLCPVARY